MSRRRCLLSLSCLCLLLTVFSVLPPEYSLEHFLRVPLQRLSHSRRTPACHSALDPPQWAFGNQASVDMASLGMSQLLLHLRSSLEELRDTQQNKIDKLARERLRFRHYVDSTLENSHRVIQHELGLLDEKLGLKAVRIQTARNLSRIIQARIYHLQHPASPCLDRPLFCNLSNPNGLASGVHDALWCMVGAYHLRKRLVLDTGDWHYGQGVWNEIFSPLTEAGRCPEQEAGVAEEWPGPNNGAHRNLLGLLPEDLHRDLLRLGVNPLPWWFGQFLGYLLRPSGRFRDFLQTAEENIGFRNPIVGMHVRRTDKIGNEASYHSLESYVSRAEDFFKSWELKTGKTLQDKRIFLATDDPQVARDCSERFPEYIFIRWTEGASLSERLGTRYTRDAAWATVLDVFLLARTDFIVCTFSSGLCRLTYELMQFYRPEALRSVHSLDVPHHYAWMAGPRFKAIYAHHPLSRRELHLEPGDVLEKKDGYALLYEALAGKESDGYTKARNLRTGRMGVFPSYKAISVFTLVSRDPRDWVNCTECR